MTTHEVWLWSGFTLFILALLALHLGVVQRRPHVIRPKEALAWFALWSGLAVLFNIGIVLFHERGGEAGLEFFAAGSLSGGGVSSFVYSMLELNGIGAERNAPSARSLPTPAVARCSCRRVFNTSRNASWPKSPPSSRHPKPERRSTRNGLYSRRRVSDSVLRITTRIVEARQHSRFPQDRAARSRRSVAPGCLHLAFANNHVAGQTA